jgi:serine beta-lactamase-like protein LACTB, mitochondrial
MTVRPDLSRRHFLRLAAGGVALAWLGDLRADEPPLRLPQKAADAVDAVVSAEMAKQEAIGVAVGIIRAGQIAYLKGYGWADQPAKVPVTSRTLFRWASISKTLTAVAALQLAEKKQLDLDADVRRYVPEFPDKGTPVTARQLLCHQGGIVHYANGKVVRTERTYDSPHPYEDVVLALDKFKESPLVNKPGEKFSYSTHGYILLSAVVQRAGGQKFADQVRDRIGKPLGLTTLQPDYEWQAIPNRAAGYRKVNGRIESSEDVDVSWKLAGGGFLSNIDDLTRWGQSLVNRKVVSAETGAQMWTPQKTASGGATTYGLGFEVGDEDGRLLVGHSGAQEKTRTLLVLFPKEKRGVAVMCNCEFSNPAVMAKAVLDVLDRG